MIGKLVAYLNCPRRSWLPGATTRCIQLYLFRGVHGQNHRYSRSIGQIIGGGCKCLLCMCVCKIANTWQSGYNNVNPFVPNPALKRVKTGWLLRIF